MKNINYIGNCTNLELSFLNQLQENNKEIKHNTIIKKLGEKYLNDFFWLQYKNFKTKK